MMNWVATRGFATTCESAVSAMCWACPAPPRCATSRRRCPSPQGVDGDAWTHLTVRDGEKGPVDIEMVKRRVQTRLERKRTGPEEWLVVTRRPRATDCPLEPRASRDATDQDAQHRYHYDLTPTGESKGALKEPSLGELARVIKAGAGI